MRDEHDGIEPVSAEVNEIGRAVMDAAFAVHRELGPGLLESVYEHCLAEDLARAGLSVERQAAVPVSYRGSKLDVGFRLEGFRRGRCDELLSPSIPGLKQHA